MTTKELTRDELVGGFNYKIKCGWGWTKAKFLYDVETDGKVCYFWEEVNSNFRFRSYDLEDTVEL